MLFFSTDYTNYTDFFVYELARIITNYMIFKICDTEYKTIFSKAK